MLLVLEWVCFISTLMGRPARDPKTQRAALALLARGVAAPGDVATLAGVSLQLVHSWLKAAGINWRGAYDARIAAAWRAVMDGPPRPMPKARMRKRAAAAKRQWDKRHGQD